MIVRLDREELDEAAFGAVQDVMVNVGGMTTRQRLTVTLNVTNALMARIDLLVKDTGKSANASRAAKKRWAKNKADGSPADVAAPTPRRRKTKWPDGATNSPADAMRTVPLAPPEGATMAPESGMVPSPFGSQSERI